jgi:hypothetical protein
MVKAISQTPYVPVRALDITQYQIVRIKPYILHYIHFPRPKNTGGNRARVEFHESTDVIFEGQDA